MARDYTYQELMAMQEEATQRVREMQRRAQLTAQRAQEELDRKKSESPPFQRRQEGPRRQKPQSTAPIGSRSTCQQARAHSGKNGS